MQKKKLEGAWNERASKRDMYVRGTNTERTEGEDWGGNEPEGTSPCIDK